MAKTNSGDLSARQHESYVDSGAEKCIKVTLGSATVVTAINLPESAKGFRIFPSGEVLFDVSLSARGADDPEARATNNTNNIAFSSFSRGGIAKASQWETRLLPSTAEGVVPVGTGVTPTGRYLKLYPIAGSETVDVEIF